MSLGQTVRELRMEKNLSVRQLAAESGVAPSTICRIEKDEGSCHTSTLKMLACSLGLPADAFVKIKNQQ